MAKMDAGKATKEVILRKSILSIFMVGMFLQASAQQSTESEYTQIDEESAIDLSKVVVTASGFSQAVKDAPASISVISGSELTDKPISGLGDALKDIEGVSVERGGKSGGANISIRGLPSDYTLVLIDGKRLSQNSSGARPNGFGDVDSNFIPAMSAIQQIEVVRGPMSTLYGSDAMGGVINIITKKVPEKWGGEINVGFIQPESNKFSKHMNTGLYAAGPLVKDTLGLALTAGFDHSTNAKGRFAKNEAERVSGDYTGRYDNISGMGQKKNYNLGGKLSFTPNSENDIILSYDRGVQRYDNSSDQLGTQNKNVLPDIRGRISGGGYSDELKFVRDRASLSHQGRYDAVTVDSSILWDETKTIGRVNPISAKPKTYDGTDRDIKYTNIIVDNKWMFGLGDHFISVGGQYRDQKLSDSLAESPFNVKQWQWALFLEDEWSITENFIATFGLRYDKNEAFGEHYSPRIYLTWNIDDSWQLKGGVSQAFKAPDLHLTQDGVIGLRRQGNDPVLGTPGLKPETSTSSELGIYFDNSVNFSSNATVFYTEFKDKIEQVTTPCVGDCKTLFSNANNVYQSFNVNDAKLYGIELGGRYQFNDGLGLKVNYTYTESSYRNNSGSKEPFSATPKHMVNAKLDWQINEAWNVWTEAEYRGKQFNALNKEGNEIYYKSYGLVNLGAKYSMNDNLSFTAGIYNLFDKKFMDYRVPQTGTNEGVAKADFVNRYKRNEEGRRFWIAAKYVF